MASPLRIPLSYSSSAILVLLVIYGAAALAICLLILRFEYGYVLLTVQAGLIYRLVIQVRRIRCGYGLLQLDTLNQLSLSDALDPHSFNEVRGGLIQADTLVHVAVIVLRWRSVDGAVKSQLLLPDMMSAEDWRCLQVRLSHR